MLLKMTFSVKIEFFEIIIGIGLFVFGLLLGMILDK